MKWKNFMGRKWGVTKKEQSVSGRVTSPQALIRKFQTGVGYIPGEG